MSSSPSLPVRECGLKLLPLVTLLIIPVVTPCAGVWIEMMLSIATALTLPVTPCAGVWIEIVCL